MTAPSLLAGRLRAGYLSGPVLMGGGLALVGAAGYGFIAVAGHTLGAADFAAIQSLYLIINIAGPGVFGALEQETNRATSGALAMGKSTRLVTRTAGLLGLGLVVLTVAVLFAASPVIVGRVFHGEWSLQFALVAGVVTAYAGYLVRGVLGGHRRFRGYAATLAAEGLTRIVPAVVIGVLGFGSGAAYAFVFAAGLAFAGLVGLPWLRSRGQDDAAAHTQHERTDTVTRMRSGLALLVGAMLLTQLVANLAPVVVTSRMTADLATAAAFSSAFILVRVPLFLFRPVQALLLPGLTQAVVEGDRDRFRRNVRPVMAAVLVIGVLGAVLSATVGPWVVLVFLGAEVRLSGAVLGLLGVSTILLMVAQVLQPALIAAQRHRVVTTGWVAGATVLVGMLFLPVPPVTAAVAAQLTGSFLVVVTMTVGIMRFLRGSAAAWHRSAEGVSKL